MTYTVIWLPTAIAQLANYWLQATDTKDRAAITQANHRIDQELRLDPEKKVSPCGKFWIFSSRPLDVLCHIDPDDRKVHYYSGSPDSLT